MWTIDRIDGCVKILDSKELDELSILSKDILKELSVTGAGSFELGLQSLGIISHRSYFDARFYIEDPWINPVW